MRKISNVLFFFIGILASCYSKVDSNYPKSVDTLNKVKVSSYNSSKSFLAERMDTSSTKLDSFYIEKKIAKNDQDKNRKKITSDIDESKIVNAIFLNFKK